MAKGVRGSSPKPEEKPIRTSFNIYPEVMEKIRYVGFMEKKDLTTIVDEALKEVIAKWEKKNGPIPVK